MASPRAVPRPAVRPDALPPAPDEVTWLRLFLYLWRLARPEFWLVSLLPYYVGYVVASRALLPGLPTWAGFWAEALTRGATTAEFVATLGAWWGEAWRFVLGAVALGPLIWGSTLVTNDYWDYHADKRNPRRSKSPLVRDLVSREGARRWAWVLGGAGLAIAAAVSPTFLGVMAACLLLSWAYSAPPLRLKARAGADVVVNVVGIGFLCSLAGWTLARPLTDFHVFFFVQGTLVALALYVPSTMVDHRYDAAEGFDTFAVRFGLRTSYRVGLAAFALSNAGAIVFGVLDFVIPRAFLPILAPFSIVLVLQYAYLIGDYENPRSVVKGVVLTASTMLVVNVCFALVYTGIWRL